MKKVFIILGLMFLIVAIAQAGTATLTWTAPTTYTDGTPIPLSDLSYVVGYGPVSRGTGTAYPTLVNVPTPGTSLVSYTVTSLPTGTSYFGVKAVSNAYGTSGAWSAEVSKTIPGTPGTPTNLTVGSVSAS